MESASQYEIANVIGSLSVHVDARRWDELLRLFAAEVRVDYTSLFGGEVQVLSRNSLIGQWRQLLPGFSQTSHIIGTPFIFGDGDRARGMASVVAFHLLDDPALAGNDQWIAGGCYEFEFHKINGQWRITSLTLARGWSRGNQELLGRARQRASQTT